MDCQTPNAVLVLWALTVIYWNSKSKQRSSEKEFSLTHHCKIFTSSTKVNTSDTAFWEHKYLQWVCVPAWQTKLIPKLHWIIMTSSFPRGKSEIMNLSFSPLCSWKGYNIIKNNFLPQSSNNPVAREMRMVLSYVA